MDSLVDFALRSLAIEGGLTLLTLWLRESVIADKSNNPPIRTGRELLMALEAAGVLRIRRARFGHRDCVVLRTNVDKMMRASYKLM